MFVFFHLQRNGTENGLSNIKDTLAENIQLQISLLHKSMSIVNGGLSSLSDGWAKYEEEVPDSIKKCNKRVKRMQLN